MAIESLAPDDQAVVRRCMAFILTTPQLDHDFETRLGVTRAELAQLVMRWPAIDDSDDNSTAARAINNALNEIANGLRLSAAEWANIGVTGDEVAGVYRRWAMLRGWQSQGIR